MRARAHATMLIALGAMLATAGCGPRQVEVRTAPTTQSEVALDLTNSFTVPVNVYVSTGGSDIFVRQVPARTTLHLPVQGIAAGTTVTLRATTIDGLRRCVRRDVVLTGLYAWTLDGC